RTMKSRVLLVMLWLQLTWMKSQQKGMEQSLGSLRVLQGATASLNCNYSDSASQYFVWYRQYSGKGPELLVYLYSKEKHSGRLQVTLNNSIKSCSLSIMASQTTDTATYVCAMEHSVRQAAAASTQTLPELPL
uniref:Ig-like domain-containing protein n=1 Tax=Ailuropoda melanoleuca TaxID=9646 RepID=G1LG70_AILME